MSKCYCFSNNFCFFLERLELLFSVSWSLHFQIYFDGIVKSNINICSTSPKAYQLEVRVGWYFLVCFITCTDLLMRFLVLFSLICFKHVKADTEKKRIRYSFINSIYRNKFLRFILKSVIKSNAKASLTALSHDLHKQSPRGVL